MAERKSVFSRYFSICVTVILVSFIFLGVALIGMASQYFKEEKLQLLDRNVDQAVRLTMADYELNNYEFVHAQVIQKGYSILGNSINSDIFLVDTTGKTLICTEGEACSHTTYRVDSNIMQTLWTDHRYKEQGKLGGLYREAYYTVGLPLLTSDGQMLGAVFASTSMQSLTQFLTELFKMFLVSALVVMLVACLVIYILTRRLVRPLQDMVVATESFSKGDFTARVPVEGSDEIGRLAMAFNDMASSLAVLEQSRRSFIANVSHELKTPMTTIGGFIDGILDGTIPPTKERHYLRIVSDEVQRLSRMVRAMLGVARIEAGEMDISLQPTDINDLVCRTVFTFEQAIEEKRLEIRGLDVDKVMVMTDVDLIAQVVYNLIDNAVKFVNDDGYIEFNYTLENGLIYVSIKNSGKGIPKEEIARVFDRFYKSDRSRSLDKNGVGLGLYIVRTIVNLHGGEIIVRSVEGQYCEFIFSVPVANAKSSQSLFRKNEKAK